VYVKKFTKNKIKTNLKYINKRKPSGGSSTNILGVLKFGLNYSFGSFFRPKISSWFSRVF